MLNTNRDIRSHLCVKRLRKRHHYGLCLVVSHVLGGGGELGVALDHLQHTNDQIKKNEQSNLVDGVQEVLLSSHLPPGPDHESHKHEVTVAEVGIIEEEGEVTLPDSEHASLCTDTPQLCTGGVGAQASQQLVPARGGNKGVCTSRFWTLEDCC